jgi:ribonuclease HII
MAKIVTTAAERAEFDAVLREKYGLVCGVDEAGRGPLAGDVYAAAVILDPENIPEGINDSKKLSEKKRELLAEEIKERALCWAIATASVAEIEELNILNAAMLAMKRAVEALEERPSLCLIDGNRKPEGIGAETLTVVGGDARSLCIGAASILAKTARDESMRAAALEYPDYGFEKHKGYGTKQHIEALKKYGICEIHRPSFLKKIL